MTRLLNRFPDSAKRKQLRHEAPAAERILWSYLKHSQFHHYKFRRQASIGRYVVDFYCPTMKLVIEIDGPAHFTEEAERYDTIRSDYFHILHLHLIRFTNDDIYHRLPETLEALRLKLAALA